jgi:hypothetical protein
VLVPGPHGTTTVRAVAAMAVAAAPAEAPARTKPKTSTASSAGGSPLISLSLSLSLSHFALPSRALPFCGRSGSQGGCRGGDPQNPPCRRRRSES